ncbi:MAG: hypothetical protein JRH11_20615, partial [Deltaproteobacteria bacterium]|nr:hypothetical protein [Deltaproteobacteria bacterium]
RIRQEELLADSGAKGAYERALALRPGDLEIEDAIEQVDQTAENWKQIAKRFVEEANDASDSTLKTSHLTRAASLIWQYKTGGRDKEVDKLFRAALEADPASTRTARLYAETLRARDQHDALAEILVESADHARNRDEKLNLYVQSARVFARRLDDRERAGQCYERVLSFSPGHEEALRFLVELFTDGEKWDKLVALYEDALRSRQKLESEQGILLQIGMVHWRIRTAPDEAEPYFGRLRKIDPAHPGMLSFYREFFAGSEDPARLLTILGDAQRVTKDPDQKLELAVELAKTAQGSDATVERAVDAWKAVQRQTPDHPEARGALRELYAKAEKWNALVELLKSEIDSLGDDDVEREVTLLREMVPIYRDKLELDVMVIKTYKAVLRHVPDDAIALQELSRTYETMGRWNDLIQVLTQQAEAVEGADEKVTLLTRVAGLWIDRFANYNHAVGPLESVVALDPENRAALSRLKEIYEKKRAWSSLFEVLKKEAELASDPEVRFQNKIELAKLAGERLHKNADAIALWREVVEQAPATPGALDALERLAEREKDWPTLAEVLEIRAAAEDVEDAPRIRILTKLGTVYGEHIDQPLKAAGAWQRVLALDPKNGRATRTLRESFLKAGDWEGVEALYAETDDWEGLVEVLGSAAERSGDDAVKIALSFRAAEVYEESIGEPQRAFRNYERVLSVDSSNVRAATALLPIYERDEKWPKVVAMKEVLLGALADDAPLDERLTLLGELGRLSSQELSDEAAAFNWAKRAYALAPEDPDLITALEAAAGHAGAFEQLAAIYRERLESAPDDQALSLRRRLATLAGEQLGNTADAISQLEQILAADPADAESVEVLDRLYRAEDRTADLRNLYQHRIDHALDDQSRVLSLRELAALEEDVLDEAGAAVAHLEQLLILEPADSEALAGLDRLHAAADRPKELADVIRRRRELDTEEATGIDLAIRLADLLRMRLDDPRGAVDTYSDVLRLAPGNDQAVAGLEALSNSAPDLSLEIGRLLEAAYESKSSYQKLADVLDRRLRAAEDPGEIRDLRLRLAELAGSQLGDVEGAYNAIEAAFLSHPADQELWERLAEAAERAGKHEELAGAYAMVLDEGELEGSDILEIASRAARIHDELLGEPVAAEPFHRMVLAEDSLDERAFEALKQIYTDGEKWDDLQVLYRNRIANTVDLDQKRELLLQVCFLFEELLDDAELAIRAYQDVLELDPDDVSSRRALDRLYRRTERWRDLAALLKQDLDGAEGQYELDLTFELGQLHEQKL